jgi:hypothetical protein
MSTKEYRLEMQETFREVGCFKPIKRKHNKTLPGRIKYQIDGTNFYLIFDNKLGWHWLERLTDKNAIGGHRYEICKPEDVFDHPDAPTDLLFHLDIITNLKMGK